MRLILSAGRVSALLLLVPCFACGGGGGPRVTTLAELQALIPIPNPGETASVLVQVQSDGALLWAAAVPLELVADVTGLTLNRASDASLVADLLGAGSFDPLTGSASGIANVTAAEAAQLAADPGDFLATLLTSTKPPASARLGLFTTAEWHTVLLGTNEVAVADEDARGAASFRARSPAAMDFVVAMVQPQVGDVTSAHIHAGPEGANGVIVVDLDVPTATTDAGAGTLAGTVAVGGETLARILADPGSFYCNVHTAAAPNGVARGQLGAGTVEMWAALSGDRETTVVDPDARGGFFVEFTSLTQGRATLAVPTDTQEIDDVAQSHIHVGAPGVPGPILVDLRGSDYSTSTATGSAESTILYSQAAFTRILANPAGFYVNFHTAAAPNGLVRGQLTRDPITFFAAMTGGEVVPPVAGTSGAMRVIFTGAHETAFTVTMQSPAASEVTEAHVHDGAAGATGTILVDLLQGTGATVSGKNITGRALAPGRTFARMLADASLFYGDVHAVLTAGGAPPAVARGQFVLVTADTPPAGLVYDSPVVYQTGQEIAPNVPTSVGGAITSYSIAPPLPAGLSLDPTTGIISGTPTATQPASDHTVTARNAAGSATATVNIRVDVGPPVSLSYNTPVSYVVGTPIAPNVPTSTGGAIDTYSVSPALPGGLNLNTSTGVITGTPTTAAAAADYTVTGSNVAGSVQAVVNITVNQSLQPPSNLSYTTPVTYSTGYPIAPNVPTVSGGAVSSWSVSPSLPQGLTLQANGTISGTPTQVTSAANYTVTASNAAGSTQAVVNITVNLGIPGPFTYSNDPNLGYKNYPIASMSPTHSPVGGAVSSYSISPALVAGLSINSSTGVISGTPTATTPDTDGDTLPDAVTYTVTASNSAGTRTTTVNITVLP